MNIITYISTLIILAVIDAAWLFTTGSIYKEKLAHLFAPTLNFIPIALFYPIYAAGLLFFVIAPALRTGSSLWQVLGTGAFLGLIAYAAYDLTNNGTLKDWPVFITVIDMLWGMVVSGLTCLIVVTVFRHFR